MEIGVPERKQGTLFVPIPVEITSYDAERLASKHARHCEKLKEYKCEI